MDEKMDLTNHYVELKNREVLSISGVKKIDRLNEKEFVLDTIMGTMNITGLNLTMLNLKIEAGEIVITGSINQIKYEESIEKKPSFFSKIFK